MAVSDIYTFRSGSIAVAATTATPVLSVYGVAAKRSWLVGVRVKIGVTAAAAGNDILFQLCRPAATNTGTSPAVGVPHDFSAPASQSLFSAAWGTAPTVGLVLAEWVLPQTTGSMWEEYPPSGDEWGIPAIASGNANAGVHMIVTPTAATSTPVLADFIVSE